MTRYCFYIDGFNVYHALNDDLLDDPLIAQKESFRASVSRASLSSRVQAPSLFVSPRGQSYVSHLAMGLPSWHKDQVDSSAKTDGGLSTHTKFKKVNNIFIFANLMIFSLKLTSLSNLINMSIQTKNRPQKEQVVRLPYTPPVPTKAEKHSALDN